MNPADNSLLELGNRIAYAESLLRNLHPVKHLLEHEVTCCLCLALSELIGAQQWVAKEIEQRSGIKI